MVIFKFKLSIGAEGEKQGLRRKVMAKHYGTGKKKNFSLFAPFPSFLASFLLGKLFSIFYKLSSSVNVMQESAAFHLF